MNRGKPLATSSADKSVLQTAVQHELAFGCVEAGRPGDAKGIFARVGFRDAAETCHMRARVWGTVFGRALAEVDEVVEAKAVVAEC